MSLMLMRLQFYFFFFWIFGLPLRFNVNVNVHALDFIDRRIYCWLFLYLFFVCTLSLSRLVVLCVALEKCVMHMNNFSGKTPYTHTRIHTQLKHICTKRANCIEENLLNENRYLLTISFPYVCVKFFLSSFFCKRFLVLFWGEKKPSLIN